MSRTLRAPAVFAALAGLVLGLLLCGAARGSGSVGGAGGVGGAGSAHHRQTAAVAMAAGTGVATGTGSGAVAPEAAVFDVPDAEDRVPGCGRGHGAGKGAVTPGVPPRTPGSGGLPSASSAAERTVYGSWAAGADGPAPAPGPDPPERAAPSPLELSILRV
ncbi:hypothetical protein ABZ990_26590 [Streptomyces sp. NPDC046203]|uniref:hypothetical protein n=1 Tax=Streptomyces sp. NPDC046203 TaxID=3154602 RepID=UPI0033CD86BD